MRVGYTGSMDSLHIWKGMSDELRTQAAEAFYADPALNEFHQAANLFIARQKNFRPAFIKRLPPQKRSFYLAHLQLSPELASQLLVSYHFAHQRPLMSAFLNALGVPNDQGLITDDAEVPIPASETLSAAVATIQSGFPAPDVQRYLHTLYSQNPQTWAGLQPFPLSS